MVPNISFTAFLEASLVATDYLNQPKKCQCFLVLLPSTVLGGYNEHICGDITKVSILSKLAALAIQLKELI